MPRSSTAQAKPRLAAPCQHCQRESGAGLHLPRPAPRSRPRMQNTPSAKRTMTAEKPSSPSRRGTSPLSALCRSWRVSISCGRKTKRDFTHVCHAHTPLPAALVCRGHAQLFHCSLTLTDSSLPMSAKLLSKDEVEGLRRIIPKLPEASAERRQ